MLRGKVFKAKLAEEIWKMLEFLRHLKLPLTNTNIYQLKGFKYFEKKWLIKVLLSIRNIWLNKTRKKHSKLKIGRIWSYRVNREVKLKELSESKILLLLQVLNKPSEIAFEMKFFKTIYVLWCKVKWEICGRYWNKLRNKIVSN